MKDSHTILIDKTIAIKSNPQKNNRLYNANRPLYSMVNCILLLDLLRHFPINIKYWLLHNLQKSHSINCPYRRLYKTKMNE